MVFLPLQELSCGAANLVGARVRVRIICVLSFTSRLSFPVQRKQASFIPQSLVGLNFDFMHGTVFLFAVPLGVLSDSFTRLACNMVIPVIGLTRLWESRYVNPTSGGSELPTGSSSQIDEMAFV